MKSAKGIHELFPRTYYRRLITYLGLLVVFLGLVLTMVFYASRGAIIDQARENVGYASSQMINNINARAAALARYCQMIRSSLEITEYMFIMISVNAGKQPLEELYQRRFAWLPVDRVAVIASNGKVLLGERHQGLITKAREQMNFNRPLDRMMYIYDNNQLELVSIEPVYYEKDFLGFVIITQFLDNESLTTLAQQGGGALFLVKDDNVVFSTLGPRFAGKRFRVSAGEVDMQKDRYLVRKVELQDAEPGVPDIWYGLSEKHLTSTLSHSRNLVISVGVVGAVAILIVGLMMLRNFNAPLTRLIASMQDVGEGRFPELPEFNDSDEIGYLARQFSGMVNKLRENQSELEEVHDALERQATTDELTGLYNRRQLYELYPKLLSEATRSKQVLIMALADLDHFKQVNDRYGHLTGDQCLRHFADILRQCCRVSDFVFRLGGEEFLVLTSGIASNSEILPEKIRMALEMSPVSFEGQDIPLTVSIGVTHSGINGEHPPLSTLLGQADHALYDAKNKGRNRVVVSRESRGTAVDARA